MTPLLGARKPATCALRVYCPQKANAITASATASAPMARNVEEKGRISVTSPRRFSRDDSTASRRNKVDRMQHLLMSQTGCVSNQLMVGSAACASASGASKRSVTTCGQRMQAARPCSFHHLQSGRIVQGGSLSTTTGAQRTILSASLHFDSSAEK